MQPRITLITLGVDDLARAVRFYRDGLGLKTDGIVGTEFAYGAVAFFDLQAGLKLALWPRTSIAHDTGLPLASPSPTAFTLGHNVASKGEVDAVMAQPQTPPRHPLRQCIIKLTGCSRGKSPLGRRPFLPYARPGYYSM
jgi:catechol 2,3-dioxygenase-like lactoylglutathione lyase family enzyme